MVRVGSCAALLRRTAALVLVGTVAAWSLAQPPAGKPGDKPGDKPAGKPAGAATGAVTSRPRNVLLPPTGATSLKDAYEKKREIAARWRELREGRAQPGADDKTVVDLTAQWLAYRLTWPEYQGETGSMSRLAGDVEAELTVLAKYRAQNQAATEQLLAALAFRLRDVLANEKPVASVNAARLLARLTEEGSEAAGDVLAEALRDPQNNDGVKYYAAQGLKNLLERWAREAASPDPPIVPRDRPARLANFAEALFEVIHRQPPFDLAKARREEIEGLRILRREAVRALAQMRTAALTDQRGQTPTVRIAQEMLKVVASDGLEPPARLDEQLEAAIGVTHLPTKKPDLYQPDYALYQVALLTAHFAGLSADKSPEDPLSQKFPWKYYAARLADGVELMRADVKGLKDAKAEKYVVDLGTQMLRVLKDMEVRDQANAADLKLWLAGNPPPNAGVYRGVADSTVGPFQGGNLAMPAKPADAADKPETRMEDKPLDKPEVKPAEKPAPGKPAPGKPGGGKPGGPGKP